jgi:hypothetical protein
MLPRLIPGGDLGGTICQWDLDEEKQTGFGLLFLTNAAR